MEMLANKNTRAEREWDLIITPRRPFFTFPFSDTWQYRDLLFMFVKRDFVEVYKQTILGPIWFFIQPLLTVAMYVVVFSRIARISTDGLPPLLFYLAGIVIWNCFQESFKNTSKTFIENAALFGKVYFPRIILPLSKILSGLLRFLIQFSLFLIICCFFLVNKSYSLHPNAALLVTPILVLIMAILGLGLGILVTSLTTKYRDFMFLFQFGVQLLMYATPVIYPLSVVPGKYRLLLMLNPMTPVIEGFRFAFFGVGNFSLINIATSFLFSFLILLIGLSIFNYTEKDFMDTV